MNFFNPKLGKNKLLLYEQNYKISIRSKLNPSSHIVAKNNSEKGRNFIAKSTNTNEINQSITENNEIKIKTKPERNKFIENKENKSIQNRAKENSKEKQEINLSKPNIKCEGIKTKEQAQLKKATIKSISFEKINQNKSQLPQSNNNPNSLNKSYSFRIPFDLKTKMPKKNSTFNNKSQNNFLLDNVGNSFHNCKDFKSFVNDSVRKNSQNELRNSLSNKKIFNNYINNSLKMFPIKKLNIQKIMKTNSKSKMLTIKNLKNCGYEFDEKSFCEGWESTNKQSLGIEKTNNSFFTQENISFDKELITTKENKILDTFENSLDIEGIFKAKDFNKQLNTSKMINETLNFNDISIISATGLSQLKKGFVNTLPINSNNTRNFSTRTEILTNGKKCN